MSSLSPIVPGSRLRMRSLQLRLNSASRLLPDSDSVSWDASCLEALWWWSVVSHLLVGLPLGLSHPSLSLFTYASDSGSGPPSTKTTCPARGLLTCSQFSISHRELLAVLLLSSGVSSPYLGSVSQPVCGQHHRLGLLAESGRHPFVASQLRSAGHLAPLGVTQGSFGAPVHSRAPECAGGHRVVVHRSAGRSGPFSFQRSGTFFFCGRRRSTCLPLR